LDFSPNIINEMRKEYKFLAGESEVKKTLGKPRRKWKATVKMGSRHSA